MGEAKRKADRVHVNAALLIDRARNAESASVESFNRDEHECPPDNVIVRRDPDKELVAGEIVGGKKIRQQFGTVEVSGWDWLKPGDRVLFSKFGGTDIELDGAALVHLHKLQIYDRKREKVEA